MSDDPSIRIDLARGVMTLTLNRPKVNALDFSMTEALLAGLRRAREERAVRCLLLTGAGRSFCAGQDVVIMQQAGPTTSYREHLQRTYNRMILLLRQMEKPVLAAINGPVAGAGLGLALAADLRIAAQSAHFAFGFTTLGLTADSGIALLLPALVGLARAQAMALLQAPLDADQALACGLVQRVLPDTELPAAACELAEALAAGPTRSYALTKRLFNRAFLNELEAVLEHEAFLQEVASRTADHREGMAAFLAKRTPAFIGS